MLSASFFWVGSEAAVNGMHPTYYYIFNDKIPLDSRLKTVKDWLQMPEEQRPHLILFYLSQVDHAEHIYGPDSKEAEEAVHLVDDCIGRMTRMVDSLHLPVNYIFVADHGMASIDTVKGGLEMPRSIDTAKFLVSGSETLRHLYGKDKKDIPAQYEALKKENPEGFDIYLPDETPARWHYTSSDDRYGRMGDILLVTKYPRMIYTRNHKVLPGEHGFDNALPQMGSSFYAWGPAFKRGLRIAPFENVNVYPLIAKILGLTVPEGLDGKVEVLEGVLK